jgi:hypothetical protein
MNVNCVVGTLFLWLFASLATPLWGQVSFEAEVNAKEVFLGRPVEVTFTLRNATGKNFTPPDFKGFSVLSGPNYSSRSLIANNVRSTEYGISFVLSPLQKGVLTIGGASVEVDGRTLRSQALKVAVLESPSSAAGEKQPVAFLRAEIDHTTAYPGQQLLLDYKIYIRPGYFKQGHQFEVRPDYSGFYLEELNYYRSYQEIVDGVEYVSTTLARLALFPQRTGELEIPPLTILLDVGERRSNPFGLGLAPVERYRLSSEKLTVQVDPFPEGAPASFTGACGKYSFQVAANRTELSTDDALSLTLRIQGNGDMKQVGTPVLTGVDSFEVFSPNILEERMEDTKNGYLSGGKIIEYLLTPKRPGVFTLPLSFSYWDPDAGSYVSSDADTLRVRVSQGTGRSIASGGSEASPSDQLLPLLSATHLQHRERYWIASPFFWLITSLPFLALLGWWARERWQTREERMDPDVVRERRLRKVVDQHLSTARRHLESGDQAALFGEVSQALGAYLRHKLNIPPAQWTKDRASAQLEKAGVAPSMIGRVRAILQTCEMALYAGQDKQEAAQRVFDEASEVIREMEAST